MTRKTKRAGRPEGDASPHKLETNLEALAVRQGIKPFQENDERFGQGADFWASDAEFDQFLEWLKEIRREGR